MSKKIKLYTIKGCPACAKAKKYLEDQGTEYVEIDVNDDPATVKRISGGDRIQIPIICSGNKCEVGFDKESFDKIIKD